jgi:hypothetical protein
MIEGREGYEEKWTGRDESWKRQGEEGKVAVDLKVR